MILSLEDVSYTYAVTPILNHVNFVVNEHDKWGVVGLNGAGKSTLLKLMAGVDTPDTGKVTTLSKYTISYCPQTMEFENGVSIYDTVKNHIQDKVEEYEIKAILNKLGLTNYSEKVDVLSGGQKKRIALSIALLKKADLYLLDEPTNHLDQDMIVWLEKYLQRVSKAIVLVTHDRYFLSRITNHIVEVDEGKLYTYEGNYADYLEKKEERYQQQLQAEHKRQRFLKTEIEWIRAGAQARTTKQKGRIERFNKIAAQESIKEKETLELKSASTRLGNKTIQMEHISKAFGDKVLFQDFSYTVSRLDRVGIIGENGCGKSTLLKMIMQQIQPDTGTITIGETVKIGYFAQMNDVFDPSQRVIDYMKEFGEIVYTCDHEPITASKMLERFLFDKDDQYKPIEKCSGGEKRRLYLCSILMQAPNILLLDEPTNDLDTETLTILEEYLDQFEGAVLAVSHDRYFLDKMADRLFVFENHAITVQQIPYSTYLETREKQVHEKPVVQRKPTNTIRRLTYMEKKELAQLNEQLPILEQQVQQLEDKLNTVSEYTEIQSISKQLDEARETLETSEMRWMELSEIEEK